MESKNFDVQLVKKVVMEEEENIVPDYQGLGIAQVINYLNVNRTLKRARERYVPPGKVHAPVRFFIPRKSKELRNEKWDDYCHRPVSYYEIAAGHYTMLKMPVAAQFAQLFCKVINADQPQTHKKGEKK
jgi:thioesterase domain-containing protein